MKHWLFAGVAAAALAVGVGALASQGAGEKPVKPAPQIPGITTADAFAQGCVSCHVKLPDGTDVRLNMALKTLKRHPNVAKSTKNAPNDCRGCHGEGSPLELSKVIHRVHFGKKDKSLFVTEFGGTCTHCHSLDLKTGAMVVKSGPKNW